MRGSLTAKISMQLEELTELLALHQRIADIADAFEKEGYGPNVQALLQTASGIDKSMGSLSVQVETFARRFVGP